MQQVSSLRTSCSLQLISQHEKSAGTIEDEEAICRGAFGPDLHYKKGAIKISFIRKSDIQKGILSVWRYSDKAKMSLDDIWSIIASETPNNNHLIEIYHTTADSIRKMKSGNWFFCVLDECNTDDKGGYHKAHAHISPCRVRLTRVVISEKEIEQIRADLLFLFRRGSKYVRQLS